MDAVDMVLSKHPYLDPARLAAAGASYGGFMINWINGHTDRFSCLVNHDGIFSLRSFYYSTEELWFPEWEFGLPFGAHQGEGEGEGEGEGGVTQSSYEQFSPDKFVHRWKTPCLVIQGGKDFRVVDSDALATFTALQRRGVASRLLYFPDENHWCLKPANSILWHDTVLVTSIKWLLKLKLMKLSATSWMHSISTSTIRSNWHTHKTSRYIQLAS
jgi:dipeptidyl aminopeptidase/acylaminoacyl peptidase